MPYPGLAEYTEAVRDFPQISILDPKLKGGKTLKASDGHLILYSGGFSIVFPIEVSSNTYALRCWNKDIGDTETRYQEISDHLKQCNLSYFVDFKYVPEGILVNGTKYAITRMEWAEGGNLCNFIEQNLQDAKCLKAAAVAFQKMVEALHAHQISHGDLQDGNILLRRNGTDVEIKLIDYDSLFVPALRGQPDSIVGLPEYQHPQRIAGGGKANEKMDYFSELVIYLSVLSLAEKPDLWSQFGERTERGLLFTSEDFKNPDQADVFRELENLSSDVKQLASKLKEFCAEPSIDQLEPLEVVLPRTPPDQIAYEQGVTYLQSEQYDAAIAEFKMATSLDPKFKEAYHGLGLAYLKMDNHGEAKKNAEAALKIDSYYQPAFQLLDVIKSFIPSVTPLPSGTSKPTSTKQPSQLSPPRGTSRTTPTKKTSQSVKRQPTFLNRALNLWQSIEPNLWQYTTVALAFVLVICIVVFATQMSAKDESLRQRETTLTSLVNENRKLENQLTEKDKRIQSLRLRNQKLLDANKALREQLDKLKPIDVEPIEVPSHLVSNQFRAASPQKIPYSNFRVRGPAIGKNNEGVVVFKREQYNKAIALFKNAIESAPNSAVIYYNLGCTYLAMREYILAGIYLLDAIAHDPNFKEAHYNLALAWFRRGYHQEAIDAAHKALTIDSYYQPARQLLEAIK